MPLALELRERGGVVGRRAEEAEALPDLALAQSGVGGGHGDAVPRLGVGCRGGQKARGGDHVAERNIQLLVLEEKGP